MKLGTLESYYTTIDLPGGIRLDVNDVSKLETLLRKQIKACRCLGQGCRICTPASGFLKLLVAEAGASDPELRELPQRHSGD